MSPRATFGLAQASRRWWVMLFVPTAASIYAYRARDRSTPDAARFGGPAQGTTYSVVLGGARAPSVVASLQKSVDSLLAVIDATMSTYDSTSEISRFNRYVATTPVAVSASLAEVLRVASNVSRASNGAFDVTIAPLVEAWGFGGAKETGRVPADSVLAALRRRVGWQKLKLEHDLLSKSDAQLTIDLNAIAPGYTVDRISEMLVARNEPNHFVEVGGEVRARGQNASGGPFRVGVEDPVAGTRRVRLVVGLTDRAMATSGNYRDFQEIDGVRYTHILDPATGVPVRHRLLSVSVLHASAAYADAWATALFVVGPERAWELAIANGLEVLLLTAGVHGDVEERATDGFKAIILREANGRAENRQAR